MYLGHLPQFKENVEVLKYFASGGVLCKRKGHHSVRLQLLGLLEAFPHFGKMGASLYRVFSAL